MSDGTPMDVSTSIDYDDTKKITVVIPSDDDVKVVSRKQDGYVTIKENLAI
jgi:hypothetical protein